MIEENIRVKCCCILNLTQQNIYSFVSNTQPTTPTNTMISLVPLNPIFMSDLSGEANILQQTLLQYQKSQPNIKQYGPIQKIYSQSGVWYTLIKNSITISLLVTTTYPISGAMQLLKKIEDILKEPILKGNLKQQINQYEAIIRDQYMQQYDNDPFTNDKVEITMKSVDSVQGLMEENIKKIQSNQEQLQVIHHKSEDVSNLASQFQKNSRDYKNKVLWNHYLAYGIAGLVIGCIILYFLYKIF